METVVKRLYEGMFLVDSGEAAADWQGITGAIETVLSRSECEVVSMKKWDERRLAYDINKKSRGTFILTYFKCDPLKITAIERDVQLSEQIMRVIVLRTDKMSDEDIAKATPVMAVQAAAAKAEADAVARAAAKAEAEAAAKAEAAAAEAVATDEAAAPDEAPVEADAPTEAPVEPAAEPEESQDEPAGETETDQQ